MCRQNCASYVPPTEGQYVARCLITGGICNPNLPSCAYKPQAAPVAPDGRVVSAGTLQEEREGWRDRVGNQMN